MILLSAICSVKYVANTNVNITEKYADVAKSYKAHEVIWVRGFFGVIGLSFANLILSFGLFINIIH